MEWSAEAEAAGLGAEPEGGEVAPDPATDPVEPEGAPEATEVAPEPAAGPGFVVCTARSGSTLLRWLIDSHPEVACPSETEIADLVRHCLTVANRLGFPDGPEAADALARATVEHMMASYLRHKNKARWCDKSLSTVEQVADVARVWPNGRFIFLY
ncbi:MAG: sulfotransferase family protein, partial [Acidimicrobiales bacterium]